MAQFITVNHDDGRRIRLNVDRILYYEEESPEVGTTIWFSSDDSDALLVQETPGKLDSLIAQKQAF